MEERMMDEFQNWINISVDKVITQVNGTPTILKKDTGLNFFPSRIPVYMATQALNSEKIRFSTKKNRKYNTEFW